MHTKLCLRETNNFCPVMVGPVVVIWLLAQVSLTRVELANPLQVSLSQAPELIRRELCTGLLVMTELSNFTQFRRKGQVSIWWLVSFWTY